MAIFPKKFEVYPDLFEKAGYHMGMTGKGWGPGDYKGQGWEHNPAGHEYQKKTNKPPFKSMRNTDYAANFEEFLKEREPGQPFCFWYGASEPHRAYEDGAGVKSGKKISDVTLPAYYPDSDVIRSDFLDYAVEVEWFDTHLGRIMKKLEEIGELDNTIILVTSDHGQPFPRVKGQIYEHGFHIPLAVRWPAGMKGGRVVTDFINARDFAPTFCEAAGVPPAKAFTGKSFLDVLKSGKSGRVDASRNLMLIGKERHDMGRPNDWGYPVRAVRTDDWLYIRNYEPERWPAGNPETGYRNVDGSPTKTLITEKSDAYYHLSFGLRPPEELYRVSSDPDNVNNLAFDPQYRVMMDQMRAQMEATLKAEGDPRFNGKVEFIDAIRYTGRAPHAWDNMVGRGK
jgi:arylsulfatase A-like enzyme